MGVAKRGLENVKGIIQRKREMAFKMNHKVVYTSLLDILLAFYNGHRRIKTSSPVWLFLVVGIPNLAIVEFMRGYRRADERIRRISGLVSPWCPRRVTLGPVAMRCARRRRCRRRKVGRKTKWLASSAVLLVCWQDRSGFGG
jgi:hypothetical protein